jgi:hypothetical protein
MFPTAPTLFGATLIVAVGAISHFGISLLWAIFAATLVVTTLVSVHRSIPRSER